MNVKKLNKILRLFEIIRQNFPSNTTRKNLFHCTCFVLDPDINLIEMDQKYPFGGLIGYGNSCMDYFFANSKVFRLHALQHDSAGSVKSTTKRSHGYCYVAPSLPSSCFFGQVTGIFFCLSVKIFASSVYALFDC